MIKFEPGFSMFFSPRIFFSLSTLVLAAIEATGVQNDAGPHRGQARLMTSETQAKPFNLLWPIVHIKTHKTGSTSVHKFLKAASALNGLKLVFDDAHFRGTACLDKSEGSHQFEGTEIVTGHMLNLRNILVESEEQIMAEKRLQCYNATWFERIVERFRRDLKRNPIFAVAAREPLSHMISTIRFFSQPYATSSSEAVGLTEEQVIRYLDEGRFTNPFARDLGIFSVQEARHFCWSWAESEHVFAICNDRLESDTRQLFSLACPKCKSIPEVEHIVPNPGKTQKAKEDLKKVLDENPGIIRRLENQTILDNMLYQCLCNRQPTL
mmetsp:Transcript_877/g.2101  ORF Transcript_877/g.2101 Transcript_877/m.2101 type:complete len:324 (-) Transcript_877:85-1056(-)